MRRTPPFPYVWLAALALGVGCSDHVDVGFGDKDASFDDDAATQHGTGGRGSSADDDAGGGGGTSGGGVDENDSGSEPAPSADAGRPLPPTAKAFPADLAHALCGALEDCYGNAALLADVLGGRDCETFEQGELGASDLSYLMQSIAAGLVELDTHEVSACLAAVQALGCDARASRLPASCKAAFSGTVLAAGECTTNLDCKGDSFCDKGSQATCPGVCSSLQAEGFPCNNNDDAQCQDGLVCFRGTCQALGVLDQACGTDLPHCKPGLTCLDQGSGLQCVAIATLYAGKLGDDCDVQSALCAPGLVCESVKGTMGKCANTVSAGADCKRAVPNQCPLDQYCNAKNPGDSGTCLDRPREGDACLVKRTPACADAHVCISAMCYAIHGSGEPCIDATQCYSGVCTNGTCEGALMCAPP